MTMAIMIMMKSIDCDNDETLIDYANDAKVIDYDNHYAL